MPSSHIPSGVNASLSDPKAWAALQASLNLPPRQARQPLYLHKHAIGSLEPEVGAALLALQPDLPLVFQADRATWHLQGDGAQALARLAQTAFAADVYQVRRQWRNEALNVINADGETVATAERGIMRLLGLSTWAVHLQGLAPDGRVWVQQRAWHKSSDPGLWDTLMGGMIAAADTLASALQRETWEEAGINIAVLQDLQHRGHFWVRRPNAADDGVGYVVERIDWFQGILPQDLEPSNQDGEVLQFALLDAAELQMCLDRREFTLEAEVILRQSALLSAQGVRSNAIR